MIPLRLRHVSAYRRSLASSAIPRVRQFKVVLDGQTLYIEKPLAQALGWDPGKSTEGVSLRLSGWEPKFFAITPTDTDVGMHFAPVSRLISEGHPPTRLYLWQTFWFEQQWRAVRILESNKSSLTSSSRMRSPSWIMTPSRSVYQSKKWWCRSAALCIFPPLTIRFLVPNKHVKWMCKPLPHPVRMGCHLRGLLRLFATVLRLSNLKLPASH